MSPISIPNRSPEPANHQFRAICPIRWRKRASSQALKPLLEVQINIGGHLHTASDPLTDDARHILDALKTPDAVGH